MKKDGDPWEMRMPAFGQKEIQLDNTLKPDSDSDTPETDWIVDHYSDDGIGDLINKSRQLERRLAVVIESERAARMEIASNLCKLQSANEQLRREQRDHDATKEQHTAAREQLARFTEAEAGLPVMPTTLDVSDCNWIDVKVAVSLDDYDTLHDYAIAQVSARQGAEKDAARYRWLSDEMNGDTWTMHCLGRIAPSSANEESQMSPDQLDAAIDAALAAEGERHD